MMSVRGLKVAMSGATLTLDAAGASGSQNSATMAESGVSTGSHVASARLTSKRRFTAITTP